MLGLNDPRALKKTLAQGLSILMMFVSGYMAYKSLGLIANSTSPAVVVLSGSMEPAFQRGDILFLWNTQKHANIGDVVVYEVPGKAIPIVHRVVSSHKGESKQLLLTKGDNNAINDIGLYVNKKIYLDREQDIKGGIVKGYLPKVGYVTILIQESRPFKLFFLGGAVLLHLMTGE